MTDKKKPEALRLANVCSNLTRYSMDAHLIAAELRRLAAENAQLLEAPKSANLFLHHCWCDVQMNEYSYEKLQQEMAAIDAAMQKEADHG